MSFTVEQKSQLARLLATENLRIEHKKIHTAMFDTKMRVLYLPIWKDMTGSIYDLLVGHEVGHALYTPSDGWHDAVLNEEKPKSFKNFLNVVEDARIEKKIQRRYPGLRSSFRIAYESLIEQDFFKIKDLSIDDLPFIDRLNLYTKSQYTMKISFNEIELGFIESVKKVETWEDVVKISNEIFEYSKNEQWNKQEESILNFDHHNIDDENIDDDAFGDDFYSDPSSGDSDDGDSNDWGNESENDDFDEQGDAEKTKRFNPFKDSKIAEKDYFDPKCKTDEAFRKNESFLLDDKAREYLYLNIPDFKISDIVTPITAVHKQLNAFYNDRIIYSGLFTEQCVNEMVSSFKLKNERYVSLLAKEFEMNKAAKSFAKNRVSETGDIDISKLSSYKFDDNIFRKVMIVPKGKSHGLILLLDCSGSMSNNMAGSIEQILILSMFCRKVGIPFRVFGFSDSKAVYQADARALGILNEKIDVFTTRDNEIALSFCRLREYLNSNLSASEYSKCFRNLVLLYNSYTPKNYRLGRPVSEGLSNTPLISSLVACQKIMLEFKKSNNLDLTNLIVVHDGDADNNAFYYQPNSYQGGNYRIAYDWTKLNVHLVDKKHKYDKKLDYVIRFKHDPLLKGVMDWFIATTDSKIFGFFLVESANMKLNRDLENKFFDQKTPNVRLNSEMKEELRKKLKTQKFLKSDNPGYSSFFFILGGDDLQVEEDTIQITGKLTHTKLKTAFMKMNKKKQVSRVFVNQFIKGIAA